MITIVVGKPGAGKSYDTTDRLANDLVGRIRQGGEIPQICTNLRLNEDNFDAYLKKYSKKEVHVEITILDDDFLSRPCWWLDLPPNSRIILDEAQFYFSKARISQQENQNLIETLSTHRHRRQDWILLTQSLTTLSTDVRRYCENVIEVLNAKSISLPWPLSISVRDIQVLLWGFGVRSQIYRTREGLLEGTYKVAWEGELIVKRTTREIYSLYRSTERKESGDSALPYADGKGAWRRALRWFLLKHGFRFLLIAGVVNLVGFFVYAHFFAGDKQPLKPQSIINQKKPVYKNVDYDDYLSIENVDVEGVEPPVIGEDWIIENGETKEKSINPRAGSLDVSRVRVLDSSG